MPDPSVAGDPKGPVRPVWDVHAHLVPQNVVEAADAERFGMRIEGGDRLSVPGGQIPLAKLTDPDALFRWMDARSISGAVLSVPPLLYRYDLTDEGEVTSWARLVNNGLRELAGRTPERLRMLSHLPLQAPGLAAALVEEIMAREAWDPHCGFSARSSVGGLTLDDPSFDPVYRSLNRVGSFVLVHPVEAPDYRLDRYYLGNLLGNPYETSLAAACLIFSGALSKYPNVRFCLAHAGGAAPYLIGRWQRGYETDRPGIAPLAVEPREALKELWFDSVAHGDAALTLLVRGMGKGRILLGSDYPFPMREDDPVTALAALTPGEREAISSRNHVVALDDFSEVVS